MGNTSLDVVFFSVKQSCKELIEITIIANVRKAVTVDQALFRALPIVTHYCVHLVLPTTLSDENIIIMVMKLLLLMLFLFSFYRWGNCNLQNEVSCLRLHF